MKINLHYLPNKYYLSTGEYFERASKRLGIEVDKDYKDIILNIESGSPTPFTTGLVTGIYEIDVYQNKSVPAMEKLELSDVYFATHESDRAHDNFVLLPHGFDPELCDIPNTGEYDVVLSGRVDANYGRRRTMYEMVRSHFNCLTIPNHTPTIEYLKQLARGKIILNVTGWKEMNRRVFDGMALGITLVDKCPNTKLLGEEGEHFLTFEGEQDIINVIENILSDKKKYDHIREKGREHAYKNHTYDIRLQTAYNKLKEIYDERVH